MSSLVERLNRGRAPLPARSLTTENILLAMFALAVLHALYVLMAGIAQPLLDFHSFRQTQTALSVYWIVHGGPWFAYETPVLGAPWSIPFEFPVYQLPVAALAWLGIPLTVAGRLLSFVFLFATLWPLRIVISELRLGRATFLATAILFLTSPLYLYWGRTFLVETCALFFAMLWLALTLKFLNRGGWRCAAGATAAGIAAVLAKATTFPAFAVLGSLAVLYFFAAKIRSREPVAALARFVGVTAVIVLLPFVFGFAWVWYSDAIKEANRLAHFLTSDALSGWNFGNMQQRLGSKLWSDTIGHRVLPETLGYFSVIGIAGLAATLTSPRRLAVAAAALLGFLVPFLVFANLHIIHSYYQSANALFLIAAMGVGIGAIFAAGNRNIAFAVLLTLMVGQVSLFYDRLFPEIRKTFVGDQTLLVGSAVQKRTTPDQSILVFGNDWSSTIGFYAERRSLTVPGWIAKPVFEKILADPQSFLGDAKLGAIVACTPGLASYGEEGLPKLQNFLKNKKVLARAGNCDILAP